MPPSLDRDAADDFLSSAKKRKCSFNNPLYYCQDSLRGIFLSFYLHPLMSFIISVLSVAKQLPLRQFLFRFLSE